MTRLVALAVALGYAALIAAFVAVMRACVARARRDDAADVDLLPAQPVPAPLPVRPPPLAVLLEELTAADPECVLCAPERSTRRLCPSCRLLIDTRGIR